MIKKCLQISILGTIFFTGCNKNLEITPLTSGQMINYPAKVYIDDNIRCSHDSFGEVNFSNNSYFGIENLSNIKITNTNHKLPDYALGIKINDLMYILINPNGYLLAENYTWGMALEEGTEKFTIGSGDFSCQSLEKQFKLSEYKFNIVNK